LKKELIGKSCKKSRKKSGKNQEKSGKNPKNQTIIKKILEYGIENHLKKP